jgi:hypothetical protein
MADVAMWKDKEIRQTFIDQGRQVFEKLRSDLAGQEGVVAIELESGDYFVGATLGKANDAAFQKYPDQWLYFVRLDDPGAATPLPTW